MVTLTQVEASNALVSSTLPPNPVAVFVGATSGIGEYTLRAFAKHAKQPRVYFIGRSQEAGDRIKADCQVANPEGEFTFIQGDVSLLKQVDEVCQRIKQKEDHVNLLVLSQGTLIFGTETEEGLHYAAALIHHSRFRFTLNLLPLLRKASGLRRVVSVFTGTKEGPLDLNDMQARNISFRNPRGHAASLVTFGLEALANKAPEVGSVHVFPGHVKSAIMRGTTGFMMSVIKVVSEIVGLWMRMNVDECGERHLYLCTSQRYAGKQAKDDGVVLGEGVKVAVGTNGEIGSGVYSVDENGESAAKNVQDTLAGMRKDNVIDKVWDATMVDFKRITGHESI